MPKADVGSTITSKLALRVLKRRGLEVGKRPFNLYGNWYLKRSMKASFRCYQKIHRMHLYPLACIHCPPRSRSKKDILIHPHRTPTPNHRRHPIRIHPINPPNLPFTVPTLYNLSATTRRPPRIHSHLHNKIHDPYSLEQTAPP